MLKHVTYRSTSSLGRMPSDLTCRGSSVTPDAVSLKGDHLPSSPELQLKSPGPYAGDSISNLNNSSPYTLNRNSSSPYASNLNSPGSYTSDRSSMSPYTSNLNGPGSYASDPLGNRHSTSPYTSNLNGPGSYPTDSLSNLKSFSPDTMSLKCGDTISLKGDLSRVSYPCPDNISLHSTLSFSSLATGRLSSRCSSTTSLDDHSPTIPVKIYLRSLRPDMEYKTVRLSSDATCRQLVMTLLAKFRLRHRDPNLFFVTMDVVVRPTGGGAPARRLLVLDDLARPAELQQCRPRGEAARFSIGVRRGGLVRVHDSVLMAGSQYKSLLVSYRTTAADVIQLLLNCYNSKDNPSHYALHEVNKNPYSDRRLEPNECPLQVQNDWSRRAAPHLSLVLRRDMAYITSRVSWRRSLDQSSTDTESEHEDHNTTLASLASVLSTSSHGSLSSSASVASSASVTSDASSSSGASSSGVSSSSSPMASPAPSPAKTKSLSSLAQSFEARITAKPPVCVPRLPHPPSSSVATSSSTLPARTTSLPPTPVPRTILNTSSTSSTLKSKSLPALRCSEASPCCSTTSTTMLSSTISTSPSSTSLSTSKSSPSPSISSLSPSIVTLSPSSTSLTHSLSSSASSLLCPSQATSFTSLSSSTSSLSTASTASPNAVSSRPLSTSFTSSFPTCLTSSSCLSSTSTTCLPSLSTSTSTSISTSSSTPSTPKEDSRPPPLPARRSSCCRNYENCFYI